MYESRGGVGMKSKYTKNGAKDGQIEIGNRTIRRLMFFVWHYLAFSICVRIMIFCPPPTLPPFIKLFPSPINRYIHLFPSFIIIDLTLILRVYFAHTLGWGYLRTYLSNEKKKKKKELTGTPKNCQLCFLCASCIGANWIPMYVWWAGRGQVTPRKKKPPTGLFLSPIGCAARTNKWKGGNDFKKNKLNENKNKNKNKTNFPMKERVLLLLIESFSGKCFLHL